MYARKKISRLEKGTHHFLLLAAKWWGWRAALA